MKRSHSHASRNIFDCSGIFYCSSVVSRKNSNTTQSSKGSKGEEKAIETGNQVPALAEILKSKKLALESAIVSDEAGNADADKSTTTWLEHGEEEQARFEGVPRIAERKFCVYFKWTNWMSKREHYSLFLFSPENKVRRHCIAITEHKCFDYAILLFISLNCVTLAMERPKVPPWSFEREFLNAANYIFTIVFALEMAIKVSGRTGVEFVVQLTERFAGDSDRPVVRRAGVLHFRMECNNRANRD